MVDVCWQCECGHREVYSPDDVQVRVGNAVFRKPGCSGCKRPMMMAPDAEPDGVCSFVRRPPGPKTPAVELAVPA